MKIENRILIVKVWIRNLFVSILFVTLLSFFVISRSVEEGLLLIPKNILIALLCIVFLFYFILNSLKKYNYLYFEDDGKNLIIRFYRLSPFANKKQYIIPKAIFYSYEVKKQLRGYRKEIIFYQRDKKNIVKYPPVSLSGLPDREFLKLKKWLDFYIEQYNS